MYRSKQIGSLQYPGRSGSDGIESESPHPNRRLESQRRFSRSPAQILRPVLGENTLHGLGAMFRCSVDRLNEFRRQRCHNQ